MLRHILVGLDGSLVAETIVRPVHALARRLGADVVLLHVTELPEIPRTPELGPTLDDVVVQQRERAEAYLARVAREIAPGRPTKTAVRVGAAAEEIVRFAAGEQVDLIALATHGRSGMQRWLYGSVADAVLHTTTTPLLLFRPIGGEVVSSPELRRLVVPLDGSQLAESTLPMAEELARALAAPILLIRVVEFSGLAVGGEPFGGISFDQQAIVDALRGAAEQYLAAVAAELGRKGLTVETRTPVGTPADAITVAAREEPGTGIVMSTHGRSGWRALLLGSVARRVVLLASGPVLLRRPAESEAR